MTAPAAAGPALRVVVLDIRRMRLSHAARLVREHAADVACLTGAPRRWRWRSRCAALARLADMVFVTGGRTAGGALVLVPLRVSVLRTRDVLLAGGPTQGAALAVVEAGPTRVGVGVTPQPSADGLAEAVAQLGVPTLLVSGGTGVPLWVGPGLAVAALPRSRRARVVVLRPDGP